MTFSGVSVVFKFLLGIFLVQSVAAVLAYVVLQTDQQELWLLMGSVALITAFLTAFWFASIAVQHKKNALEQELAGFSKKHERLKVKAEREKTRVIERSHQQINKAQSRAQRNASLKVSAAFAAMIAFGALLMLSQLISIGILTLTTAGGALGGYLFRGREARLSHDRKGFSLLTSSTRKLAGPIHKALVRKAEGSASAKPPFSG